MAAPVSFGKNDCDGYKAYLDTQLAQHQPAIHSVQMVLRENLFGFQGNQKSPYLKITVTDPKFINKLRTTIEGGLANYKGLWKGVDGGILTFDSIQYVLRFMIDTGVRCLSVLWYVELMPWPDLRHVMGRSATNKIPYYTASRSTIELPDRSLCSPSGSDSPFK